MNALEIDIAEKTYPFKNARLTALADLRFSIGEGEFACIVGPSGCGKTTILNVISGLDADVDGIVHVNGATPAAGPAIGYMFQGPRLMPWLTVRENVRLVLGDGLADDGRVDGLLSEMGLEQFVETYPNRLSGGMQRRVALARALVTEPRLLLLDEPFLSLDVLVAHRMRRLLIDLCGRRPTTVLFVTHDLREALYLADRVLFMSARPGRIVLDLAVTLPRPRDPEGTAVEAFRLNLLKEHPKLLAGLTEADCTGCEHGGG